MVPKGPKRAQARGNRGLRTFYKRLNGSQRVPFPAKGAAGTSVSVLHILGFRDNGPKARALLTLLVSMPYRHKLERTRLVSDKIKQKNTSKRPLKRGLGRC